VAPIASLQPPYSRLATEVEDSTLPFALEHHVGDGVRSGPMTDRIAALPEDDWSLVETLRAIGGATTLRPARGSHRMDTPESRGKRGNRRNPQS
jgi:hypothetical protein